MPRAFYIRVPSSGVILSFDCVENSTIDANSTLTEYFVEAGSKQADHVVNDNISFSVDGVITDVKTPTSYNTMRTDEWIDYLFTLRDEKIPFDYYYRDSSNYGSVVFSDLYFTAVKLSNDSQYGLAVNGYYSYKVSLQFKQIQYAEKATITNENLPKLVKNNGKGTSEAQDKTNPPTASNSTTKDGGNVSEETNNKDTKYLRDQIKRSAGK